MSVRSLSAPCRLHFGLLARDPKAARQFGGLGLMIREPRLAISAMPDRDWNADGPRSGRVLATARLVANRLADQGAIVPPMRFTVDHAPPEHAGFGSGTQLGLTVTRLIVETCGLGVPSMQTLAELSGRGRRSGVGLHGFSVGGLIVDGGRGPSGAPPPLLARLDWPEDWSILLLVPDLGPGLHGSAEEQTFDTLPPTPESLTDRLARLVLLGILPAVAERDLDGFDGALTELQSLIGRDYAPAQSGPYAHESLGPIADWLRRQGLVAVGQSSWGPALYGVSNHPEACAETLASYRKSGGPPLKLGVVTSGDNRGVHSILHE